MTEQQIEILRLLREGHKDSEIMHELGIGVTDFNSAVKDAIVELNARTRVQAVVIAIKKGAIKL